MATVTTGHNAPTGFSAAETVTATTLNNHVNSATVTNIVNADISASAAIALSKLATGALPTGITVASANLVDGTIVNADVSASAAIAGTKIAPDFGSQNIVTTGTLGAGATTLSAALTLGNNNIVSGTGAGTKIGTSASQKLGFFDKTPVVQPAAANQAALTNSTGGTADGTLAAVSGTGDDADINNNFTELHTLLNEIRTALVNLGLIKGAA
jgi:hypothetical protein